MKWRVSLSCILKTCVIVMGGLGAVRGSGATAVLNLRVLLWNYESSKIWGNYRDADKSLARPGRKQVNVSVRMA